MGADRVELPADRPRPAIRNPLWRRLAGRAPGDVELFAAFAVFVGKIANTRDFVIGRGDLAIAIDLDPNEPFAALAQRLATAPAIDVEPSADPARHPRCDVGFGAAVGDLYLEVDDRNYTLVYDAQLFTAERAGRLARAFAQVLRGGELRVGAIPLLDATELDQLAELSTPIFNWPKHLLLHELFEAKVDHAPHATALVFGDQRISYAELDGRANALAQRLVASGVGRDAIVALIQERTPEMIIAILGVLKAGGAYLPIEPDAPAERIRYLLTDSGAVAVVATAEVTIDHPRVLVIDDATSADRLPRRAEPEHLAYVIYTSGSTGQPKGVLVEHRNVVHFVIAEKEDFAIRSSDALMLLSSYSFDASIDQIWLALSSGAKLVLVDKSTLLDPARLARLITAEAVTHLDTVPALLAELSPMLPSVRQVVVGGETCPVAVARAWCRTTRFWNEYGPTETTVGSLRQLVDPAIELADRIPIGRPIGMTRVHILDWGGCPVPIGVRGELHLGGAGVARGYLHRDALTREKFVGEGAARRYRTGDLVAWLPDGSVEFFGRVDSQVKVRGFRIELGELEAALLKHPDVSGAAASVFGAQQLVCHFVANRPFASHELREFLARTLPAYMIADFFVQLEAFPRTVSGKIDRRALPAPQLADGEIVPPANQVEHELRDIWSRLLSLPAAQIGVTRSFFELGGHSLLVMQLLSRVRESLGVALASHTVLAAPTIRAIAAAIAREPQEAVPRATAGTALAATSVQRRMYVIQQGNPRSTSYNLPLLYAITGTLTEAAIARACVALIERHESLRTTFFFQEGEILQKIAHAPKFVLERFELGDLETATTAFVRPFRLEAPPLFRAAVFIQHGRVAYLALDMHHIISDGMSIDVLLEDLLALAQDRALPPVALRYFDYSAWLASDAGVQRLARARTYWGALLRDELPVLELPYDVRRPLSRQQAAGELAIELPEDMVDAIAHLARDCEATPFGFYAALYSVFVSCLTGSAEIVFGFPTAGRPHPDFERVVGMFVNSLPFRTRIDSDATFAELVTSAMAQIRESLRNEDYPFEDMVTDLRLPPAPGRNPIFDTMLSYEGQMPDAYRCGDATLREHRMTQRTARMDLVLVIREHSNGGASLRFEYSADLFARSTIERFANDFAHLVRGVLADPAIRLAELHTVDAAGRERLLHGLNATAHELPAVRSVHELFEHHADERPDAIAVEMSATSLTYREVERRANALAHVLRARGIGRDKLVAIQLEPCPEMLVSVLAVLKAGGAFLPIDPEYPAARKAHMVSDSGTRLVLTRGTLSNDLAIARSGLPDRAAPPNGGAESIERIDLDDSQLWSGRADRPDSGVERDDLAYCIYTSGSTGLPKGTLIEHRGLLNFSAWYADYFAIRAGDGVSKYAGFGFDASISELVPCFISGARLVVVPADIRLLVDELDAYFAAHGVAIAFLPTQFGEAFLRAAKHHALRAAFLGGEKLRNRPTDRCEIINGYGPTEYTVAATAFRVTKAYDNIPIGKPLWNTQILILDRLGRLCPIGVAGELCISGASTARGYLNRPELTAEKFVDHPFAPGRRMYRTGDLARWLADGNLEFLGRIDTQVKVRGFRVELGEIEQALLALPGITGAVVVTRESGADVSLVAFVTGTTDEADAKAQLQRVLPAYMTPARIVTLDAIPLTANGKVDRRRLPEVALELTAVVEPKTPVERELRAIYAEILGRPEATISCDASFVELGGHSLKAAVLLSAIYRQRGVQLRFAQFLAHSSVAALAELLDDHRGDAAEPWETAPETPLPLTSSQRRIFAVHQLSTWSTAYNIPFAWELAPALDLDRLAAAIAALVPRHHSLRAAFTAPEGVPVQAFTDVELVVERLAVEDASLRVTLEHFVQPFDLAVAPLMRAAIIVTEARRVLALDIHHIIADGLAVRLLLEDLEAVYLGLGNGTAPSPSAPTFADYAYWESSAAGRATRDDERAWWLARFAEHPNPLELPCDFARPPRLSFDGDEVAFELSAETSAPLLELARSRGITPIGVFLAAWAVVLSRLGNTPDVVIGVPAAGRQRPGTERIVGMFVNTVPLRLRLRADEPFSELCVRVGNEATEAFERQSYQLDELVTDLGLARDPSRNPLFDVLFSWEEAELVEMQGSSLGLAEIPAAQAPCKFDLELTVQRTPRGERIALSFAKKLFRRTTAERFLGNLRRLLEQAARAPDSQVHELRMLQPWEREMLLAEFNETEVAVPERDTMLDLFAAHVRERPDAIAVEDAGGTYDFAEVDRRAAILAAILIERGVQPDDVVALAMERSRELVVAILGVWRAGAGYLPIEPDAPAERVAMIVEDSRARVLVTAAGSFGLPALDWDAIDWTGNPDVPPRARPEHIAYVIYTSGSTGKPKGVVIEQRHVVNFIATSQQTLAVDHTDRILLFSSFTFDASVAQLGLAMAAGARLVVPTKDVLLDHEVFERWLADKRITHLDAVPLFLSGFTPKQPLALRRMVVGGDICAVPVAARWAPAQPFYNEYGPTETTITALRHSVTADDFTLPRIPIGRPVANTRIYILDWTYSLAPLGVAGEMYIGGAGVARGYLNNDELTAARFVPNPYVPGDRLYKTGDIARWLPDGVIDFLGRADNQVKIRGFRIELGEIEGALLRHPAVAEAAVIVIARGDDKRLCGYVVLRSEITSAALRGFLQRTLPSYMCPDAIVILAALPVTVSGKIDRKRLPEPAFDAAGEDDKPETLAEERLIEIWAEVLKLARHQIPVERSFFELGGHSLLIMLLISRIQQAFTVRLTAADVFDRPTIRGLAALIEQHERQAIVPIPHVTDRDHYPLSSVQRRLFAIHQTNPMSVQYNMPTVFAVEGRVTPERLEEVVRALIARHASLRTSFHVIDGEPRARIHATAPFELRVVESDLELDELMQRLMQPFDLAIAPLWRVWLVRRSNLDELLVVDIHHIVADGYSTAILWREVSEIIRGVSLAPPRITVGDFAVWQESPEHQRDVAKQRAFWTAQYATHPAPLQLPYDFRHPAVRSHEGDLVVAQLPPAELAALAALSRSQDSTLFATLLSCWFLFLSRIGGTDDIVVGVPVAGRVHPDLHDVIGMFVNTVPWRAQVPATGTFLEFLAATRRTSLDVLESEEYQLEELLDDLNIRALPGRNPLFDVMFVFETRELEVIDATRVRLHFRDFLHRTAKLDLTLVATESESGLELAFEFATELFERATIERLARHFVTMLRDVIRAPQQPIAELALLDVTDRAELDELNATAHALPAVEAAHHVFEEWARRTPDAPAVIFGGLTWSYAQVDRRANTIAAWLVERGVGRDDVVAILLDPCAEMLPAMLGVLKAGAAFLPIDSEYPAGRKAYLLEDSRASALLTRDDLSITFDGPRFDLAELAETAAAPSVITRRADAAYVIYTSGSTGKPKGVVIEHRNLINFALWYADYYGIQPLEGVAKYAGFSFDASISEVFPTCMAGATLVVVPAEMRLQPRELSAYYEAKQVRVAFLPTQFGEQFLRLTENRSLRIVTLAGEKLRAYRPMPWQIVNGYGPTEYTVCTTAFIVDRPYDNIPIGKPVWNTEILVLDRHGRLCPIGIAGELCVAGASIARGYLHKPELTAERFVMRDGVRIYRTGDLARWRPDGNLEYLGRIDTQVKIRGYRIELGEIEQTLLDVPGISDATVVDVIDEAGAAQLVGYYVGTVSADTIREALANQLPDYMIPAYLSRLDALPLTPNGKVDRRALPAVDRGSARAVVPPTNDTERALVAIWAEVLSLDAAKIGVTASFLELGGHSLKAIALVSEVYKALGCELRVSDVFRHSTVRALALRVAELQSAGTLGPIERAGAQSELGMPASSVQARMFLLQQMEPATTAYNVASLFAVAPGVERDDVAAALAVIANRYDAFRAEVFLDGTEARLRFAPTAALALADLATTEADRDADAFALVRPFDLATAPLARATWLTTERGQYLFFDMHHLVTDGVSMAILLDELEALVAGKSLAEPARGLADCTAWEHGDRARELLAQQRDFWRATFPHGVPALGLLTDLPRPPVVMPEGETIARELQPATVAGLRELARVNGLSLHALILSAFDVFLARITRQTEIAVGTVASGRWHPDMQRVFGMFVNTLVLANTVDPKQPFVAFATAVAKRSLEAIDNQAFPFAELVDMVGDGRHAGHTPLVDVLFAMQNADDRLEQSAMFSPCAIENRTAKFDLSLVVDETRDGIQLAIEYRTSLFRRATIERYLRCLDTLLADIAARPEAPVESLAILADADRRLVQVDFNRTAVTYPDDVAVHRMFERAATRFPEKRAFVDGARAYTYAQADAAANRLANRLFALGLGREAIVAILGMPSAELVIAELAALKAGAAFMPLDHRYPRDRLEYMLRDSAARVLIAAPGLADDLDWAGPRLVLAPTLFEDGDTTRPQLEVTPSDLAYVIYTSGSTGRPKGVQIEHGPLLNYTHRSIDLYGMTERDRQSKYAGVGFDASMLETFPPLCTGAELHIVPDEIRLSVNELAEWMHREVITVAFLPTTLGEEFMKEPRTTKLRWLAVGGDRLSHYHPQPFGLVNEYGPTETTISTISFVVTQQHDNIPIGKPIPNTRALVFDPSGQLCPPGIAGEICIAGSGLARGYLGSPELTAKKFVDNSLAGGRMYHTGDLGRWLGDGNLEFLGRIDSQVKIRGFRIELGEIQHAMLEVAGVTAGVVIDRDDTAGDRMLCGYYVGKDADVTAIREHLARRLPDYMCPSAFVRLDEIPFTTSGKVDRARLPEPVFERRERVAVAPTNAAEMLVLEAFARSLGRTDLGIDDDFFDFGGNSIKAVAVVAALASDFRITANDLFRLRTARAIARDIPMRRGDLQGRLAALVTEIRDVEAEDPLAALAPELAEYRRRWRPYAQINLHQRQAYRDILLTGATGFLGAYLLRDLLLHTDSKVHVAVRAKKRREGWDRIAARCARYFGPELLETHGRRIHILPGDLSEPQLGLDRGTYDALGRTIDCAIHAAALTKHYGDHSAFVKANVDATRGVIDLARRAGCDLNVISTTSVGAGDIPGKPHALFTEFDCDIGQVAGNLYVRTKLDAEKAVDELRAEGQACTIFRVGFLTGDSQTLQFQENADDSGFVQTMKSYLALGKIPNTAVMQSFCPVNEVSAAILHLLGASSLLNETHHLDRMIEAEDAARIVQADPRCEAMDEAAFFEWLGSRLGDPAIGQAATAMLLHQGLLDEGGTTQTVTLREKTDRLLARAGFAWSAVRPEQVWSLVSPPR